MKECFNGGFIGCNERKGVSEMRRENHARTLEVYRQIFGDSDPLSRESKKGGDGNVFPIRPEMKEIPQAANDR